MKKYKNKIKYYLLNLTNKRNNHMYSIFLKPRQEVRQYSKSSTSWRIFCTLQCDYHNNFHLIHRSMITNPERYPKRFGEHCVITPV